MFIGEHNHTLDAKGRLIIPAKFRTELGEQFIVTKGYEKCLWIYSMDAWQKFQEELLKLPKINTAAARLTRHFAAGATYCELDKQGRILLPANLREFAYLDKEVVLAGMLDHIEIWSKDKWDDETGNNDMEAIADGLQESNITL